MLNNRIITNVATIMVHVLITEFSKREAELASAIIAFTNELSIFRHDKFIGLKHYLKPVLV